MGLVRDAKKDDMNEGNQWPHGLSGTDMGARVPAIPRDFLPWRGDGTGQLGVSGALLPIQKE
uniref:Uncharacterized protein n=1 Tax=Oryza nivara TaxID=4536 RepID=A0A0E0HQX2_ORYNI